MSSLLHDRSSGNYIYSTANRPYHVAGTNDCCTKALAHFMGWEYLHARNFWQGILKLHMTLTQKDLSRRYYYRASTGIITPAIEMAMDLILPADKLPKARGLSVKHACYKFRGRAVFATLSEPKQSDHATFMEGGKVIDEFNCMRGHDFVVEQAWAHNERKAEALHHKHYIEKEYMRNDY